MSFFDNISSPHSSSAKSSAKSAGGEDKDIIKSITENIAIMIANRNDLYWAYNFKKQKMIAIHEIFKMEPLDHNFESLFADAVEAFDQRLSNIVVKVEKIDGIVRLMISGNYAEGKELPNLFFELN